MRNILLYTLWTLTKPNSFFNYNNEFHQGLKSRYVRADPLKVSVTVFLIL